MTDKNQNIDFLDNIFCVIEELYVYIHLKNHQGDKEYLDEDLSIARIIMIIIISVFALTILKMILIFLYFLILDVIMNTVKFLIYFFQRKCKVNCYTEIKFSCYHLFKILKKLYTYNFYSYQNKIFGSIIVTIYLIFITFNIIFASEYTKECEEKEPYGKSVVGKILQIIAFELSVFIELVCCTFYITRNLRKQYMAVISVFCSLNGIIFIIFLYRHYNNDPYEVLSTRIAHLIFLTVFLFLFGLSLNKVIRYNLSYEHWKCNIDEKLKFYTAQNNQNETAISLVNDEQNKLYEISSKIKLKGIYSDVKSPFVFKKKDRFFHRKKIICLQICIIIFNITEVVYTYFRINEDDYNENFILKFRRISKFFSMLHTVCILILSWFIFLKLEIRTAILH